MENNSNVSIFLNDPESQFGEIDSPKTCRQCGKKTRIFYEEVILLKGETYKGNATVFGKRKPHPMYRNTHDMIKVTRNLWKDFSYGAFCTARCAIQYANNVVRFSDSKYSWSVKK
jgi:hypothetical protein|tara:strand:+ start:4684 stop:5028 length:345 start_codon:yes stop_codon:yes gene_type:complete